MNQVEQNRTRFLFPQIKNQSNLDKHIKTKMPKKKNNRKWNTHHQNEKERKIQNVHKAEQTNGCWISIQIRNIRNDTFNSNGKHLMHLH